MITNRNFLRDPNTFHNKRLTRQGLNRTELSIIKCLVRWEQDSYLASLRNIYITNGGGGGGVSETDVLLTRYVGTNERHCDYVRNLKVQDNDLPKRCHN